MVHVSSGVAALIAALIIGPRIGHRKEPMPPHNLTYTFIGASLLWVGWFGFNAGSSTAADFIAGQAMLVTQIASAAGVIGWTAVELSCYGRPSSLGMVSGAIAGLVGVTPASGSIGAMGAICVGVVSGAACFNFCTYVKEAIGTYDDSLDVFGEFLLIFVPFFIVISLHQLIIQLLSLAVRMGIHAPCPSSLGPPKLRCVRSSVFAIGKIR